MSNFRRIIERSGMDRGARRRYYKTLGAARRGDTLAIAALQKAHAVVAKRNTRWTPV
jgi:hypothetical protein